MWADSPELHCSHTQSGDVDEGSDQSLDLDLGWVLQHGRLLEAFAHYEITSNKFMYTCQEF